MLAHRHGRWANITPTLFQRFLFTGITLVHDPRAGLYCPGDDVPANTIHWAISPLTLTRLWNNVCRGPSGHESFLFNSRDVGPMLV